MRDDIKPGNPFLDYELPDHLGVPRRLSALQGDDPMLLTLLRGLFCPKDRQQLHRLVPFHDECVVGYTRLVTITTDNDLVEVNELRQGAGAHWPFLYDADRVAADDLGIHTILEGELAPPVLLGRPDRIRRSVRRPRLRPRGELHHGARRSVKNQGREEPGTDVPGVRSRDTPFHPTP